MATKKQTKSQTPADLAPAPAAAPVAPAPVAPVAPALPSFPKSTIVGDLSAARDSGAGLRQSLASAVAELDNAFWFLPSAHAVRVGRSAAVDALKSKSEYLESVILTLSAQSQKAVGNLIVVGDNLTAAYSALESENQALADMIADHGSDIGTALSDYEREEKRYLLEVAVVDEQTAAGGLLLKSWASVASKIAGVLDAMNIETAALKTAGSVVASESEDQQAVKAIESMQAAVMAAESGTEETGELVEVGQFHIPQSLVSAMRATVRLFDSAADALRSIGDRLYRCGVRSSDFSDKEFKSGMYKEVLLALLDSHSLSLYQMKPTTSVGKENRQAVVDRLKASYGALQRAVARTETAGSGGARGNVKSFPVRLKSKLADIQETLQKYSPKAGDPVFNAVRLSAALASALSELSGVDTVVLDDGDEDDRIGLDD